MSEPDMRPKVVKQVETYKPEQIFIKGAELQQQIFARADRIEKVHASLLEEITNLLKKGAGDPAEVAATVLVALADNYNLSAHALSMQAFIQRAAALQAEQRDLIRFGKNLLPTAIYELSWEEADRFGL